MESIIVRHLKTASYPLIAIIPSNIITQELEILEKANIFDIESVTIEYPVTVTEISKPIKQPEFITQQSSKGKVCTETKAVDWLLQLDLIKKYILPKKC